MPDSTLLEAAPHEALFDRSIFLLVSALIIGALCGRVGMDNAEAFCVTPFEGVLALFLIEMGTAAGRRTRTELRRRSGSQTSTRPARDLLVRAERGTILFHSFGR